MRFLVGDIIMRGKLTFAPFDENFDCFYTDVSIGILPYDYEICIKQPLDKSFEELISDPYDFEESIDCNLDVAADYPDQVELLENVKKDRLYYLRNGAAGALRNLNVKETARRNLSAFFYDVGYKEGTQFKTYLEMMEFIKEKGLPMDDYLKVCTTIDEIQEQIDYIKGIREVERQYSGKKYRYVPKSSVRKGTALRKAVKNGDIIAITCNKKGLDIAHLGIAVWKKDGLHLLNASQIHKKVVLEPMLLGEYLYKHPSHTGIRIVEIL